MLSGQVRNFFRTYADKCPALLDSNLRCIAMDKLTILRAKDERHLSLMVRKMDVIVDKLKQNRYGKLLADLRELVPYTESKRRLNVAERLPMVLPSAEFALGEQGALCFKRCNGLLALTTGQLPDQESVEWVKRSAMQLPTTLMACTGASGRSVKILVKAMPASGELPVTEEATEAFLQQAYQLAVAAYSFLSPAVVRPLNSLREGHLLYAAFRLTEDAQLLYREDAAPIRMADLLSPAFPRAMDVTVGRVDEESLSVQMTDYLKSHYAYRYNEVLHQVEYRSKEQWYMGWRAVDEKVFNSMALELNRMGIKAWERDLNRFLSSAEIMPFNPVRDYLWSLQGKWDGKDHIGTLAARIQTDTPQWPRWFRTWLLATVAQWMDYSHQYGNSLVPLLISHQGYGKSTFCKKILPPQFAWGYNDSLQLEEKKQVLLAMNESLLINLDEFNKISPKTQEGFLKNVIQLASMRVKRPYARITELLPRRASFIATSNLTDILADPSGSRRFIAIELKGPIDNRTPIPYDQFYAQAVHLLTEKERYYLNEEETDELMRHNLKFQLVSPAVQYFHECFEVVTADEEGVYLSAAAIFSVVRKAAGAGLKASGLNPFGRLLANMEGLERKRTKSGTVYRVRRK